MREEKLTGSYNIFVVHAKTVFGGVNLPPAMQSRTLPHTDLLVSRACLGTMAFGSQTDEVMAARMIDVCLERGVNFIDTANVYNFGQSETIVGRILKGRRNRVVVASKVGMKVGDGLLDHGLSRDAIVKNLEETLQRLQLDYLDIYYMHLPDYQVPVEETLEALDRLIQAGKVRYPAISNYAAWQACRMFCVCAKQNYRPPMISQPLYNLLARGIEQEYIPFCSEFQVSLIVYNPLARGLLTELRLIIGRHAAKYAGLKKELIDDFKRTPGVSSRPEIQIPGRSS